MLVGIARLLSLRTHTPHSEPCEADARLLYNEGHALWYGHAKERPTRPAKEMCVGMNFANAQLMCPALEPSTWVTTNKHGKRKQTEGIQNKPVDTEAENRNIKEGPEHKEEI